MRSAFTTAGSVLFLALCCFAGDHPSSAIHGQITDSEGAAITNARVLVHWDSSGSRVGLADNIGTTEDLTVMTDANGRYHVAVPPGFYDVFVTSMSFTPVAAKVRVRAEGDTTFDVRLLVDPLVCEELCDPMTGPAPQ